MILDDLHMAILAKLIPGARFIEVEGMAVKDNTDYMILVNPIIKTALPPSTDHLVAADKEIPVIAPDAVETT